MLQMLPVTVSWKFMSQWSWWQWNIPRSVSLTLGILSTLHPCSGSSSTVTPVDTSIGLSLRLLYHDTCLVSNADWCLHSTESIDRLPQLASSVQLKTTALPAFATFATLVTRLSSLGDNDGSAANKITLIHYDWKMTHVAKFNINI